MLSPSTVAEEAWWIVSAMGTVSGLRPLEAAPAAAPAAWETSATSTWTRPWWPLLRLPYRVAGGWWECWHSRVSQLRLAQPQAVQALLETRRSTAQETATTAAAQLHLAGVQALMQLVVEVGLTQALAPVWSQSLQGGGCKWWGVFFFFCFLVIFFFWSVGIFSVCLVSIFWELTLFVHCGSGSRSKWGVRGDQKVFLHLNKINEIQV